MRNLEKENIVKVSDITESGFWIETYKERYYISRKDFPWFRDATNDELKDVWLCLNVDAYHGDVLIWDTLNCDLATKDIADPSWVKTKNIYVRDVWRSDLQDWAKIK